MRIVRSQSAPKQLWQKGDFLVADGALQDTGRDAECQCIFLTSILPPDILRGSSLARGARRGNAGGVAQLGERLNGIQEVRGSIPLTSIPVPVGTFRQ